MNKLFSFFFVLVFFSFAALAQRQEIDSLKTLLAKLEKQQNYEADTNYLNILNELTYKYHTISSDTTLLLAEKCYVLCEKANYKIGIIEAIKNKGLYFWRINDNKQALQQYFKALTLAEKISYTKGISGLYNNIANIYSNQGNYSEALENYFKSLKINEAINDKKGAGVIFNNIGLIYNHQGNYPEALTNCFKSLKINEEIGDKKGIAGSLNNIGLIYSNQENYPESLVNYLKSLKIKESIGDKKGIAASLNNIGLIYNQQGNYPEALANYLKSLKIRETIGDRKGIALSLHNIGLTYNKLGNYQEALSAHFQSLKIKEEIAYKSGIASSKNSLAITYLALKDYKQGLVYGQSALILAKELGEKEQIKNANETLSKIYEAMGKYDKALLHYKDFKLVADSLNNKETEKKTANLQAQYEYDKKMAVAAAEQSKKDIEKEKELQEQRYIRNGFIAGLGVMILIALLIFRNLRKQTKAKKLLQAKNEEILEKNAALQEAQEEIKQQAEELLQNNEALNSANNKINEAFHVLNEQNEDIIASINAAKRIQQAMLPFESRINAVLPEHFILFMPRDIVSGDFYWLVEKEATKIIIVADCTGHGVPGALMSMIGMNLLEEIINTKNITEPDKILYHLHKDIHSALQHEKTEAKEGMDIAVVTYSPKSPEGGILSYAGAMNPLYYVQNNELFEIKATKKAIGGQLFDLAERHYEKHEVILQVPTTVYLCTDGYQDQFGGEKGKKFMTKRLKELLLELSAQEMKQQGIILRQTIDEWMLQGNEKQIDDITILGLKV